MSTISIIIIIIVIIVILFLLTIIKHVINCSNNEKDDGNVYNYFDIRPKLKTGDIILFSCNNHITLVKHIIYYSRTKLIGSQYGHVGIVIKKNDKLYLAECTAHTHTAFEYALHLNNYGQGGVRIIDLDTILEEYSVQDLGVFAVKFIHKEIPYEKIMKNINNCTNCIFQNKALLFFLAYIDLCISHNLAEKITYSKEIYTEKINGLDCEKIMCSEFVHRILYNCDALDKYSSKIFWPSLITSNRFKQLEIINFSRPYKFIYKKSK